MDIKREGGRERGRDTRRRGRERGRENNDERRTFERVEEFPFKSSWPSFSENWMKGGL